MDRLLSADTLFIPEPQRDRKDKGDERVETHSENAGSCSNGMGEKGRYIRKGIVK